MPGSFLFSALESVFSLHPRRIVSGKMSATAAASRNNSIVKGYPPRVTNKELC
jgi:hypothetical protein